MREQITEDKILQSEVENAAEDYAQAKEAVVAAEQDYLQAPRNLSDYRKVALRVALQRLEKKG